MSEPTTQPKSTGAGSAAWMILILGIVVCAFAINNKSFWLDEAGTADEAGMSSFSEFWKVMREEGGSVLQMPFYYFYIWTWEKASGVGEVALRAANIPWFLLGLWAWACAFSRKPHLQWGMALPVLTSAFTWYYLNEVRPYAIQIGCSLAVIAALYRLGMEEDEPARERLWVYLLCGASLFLAASFMFAMMFLGAYLVAALFSAPKQRLHHLAFQYRWFWSGTGVLLLGIGLYFSWTVINGSRGTDVGTTDFRIFVFIPYELFGFSGLGPGRLAIRSGGLSVFKPWLPLLVLYGAVLSLLLLSGVRHFWGLTSRKTKAAWLVAIAAVAGLILSVGIAVHFRVLGRHFSTLLPICLILVGFGLTALLKSGRTTGRAIVAGYVVLSLLSCLSLRLAERHEKDDYKSAAILARAALAKGEIVWWNAYERGAWVYGVPLNTDTLNGRAAVEQGQAILLRNPPGDFAMRLAKPDLVLTSRPDVYDAAGVLAGFLRSSSYHCVSNMTAFAAWRRNTD